MSFILEALKKSERERGKRETTRQDVRKRTLVLSGRQSSRRWLYGLSAALVLVACAGWLFFEMTDSVEETIDPSSVGQEESQVPAAKPETESSPAVVSTNTAPAVSPPVNVQPAPVPRPFAETPSQESEVVDSSETPQLSNRAAQSEQSLATPENYSVNEEPRVETIEVQEPQAVAAISDEPARGYPLYADLSRELRNRMPKLEMSMHFYTEAASRRLVRINGRLMHEGDWIDQDLQLVEIISTGVLLDYLGKEFELQNQR